MEILRTFDLYKQTGKVEGIGRQTVKDRDFQDPSDVRQGCAEDIGKKESAFGIVFEVILLKTKN